LGTEINEKKKGSRLGTVCSVFGLALLLLVILICLPLTVPRMFGYELYAIVSGSMEPAIPVGSVVYAKEISPGEIAAGDVIVFYGGHDSTTVITHRTVENHLEEQELLTKGDANEQEDMKPVRYGELIGRVSCHYPVLGLLLEAYTSTLGKVYLICFAACGAMLNMLAGRLRNR